MSVANSGPTVNLVFDDKEVNAPTSFNSTWEGTKLSGYYILYVGDVPNSDIYFPNVDGSSPIFLSEASVRVKLSTKVMVNQLPLVRRIFEIKKLLGLKLPLESYTITDLQGLISRESRVKVNVVSLSQAIQSGHEVLIARLALDSKPSYDQILDIYAKAVELRSNYLINLARILSRS
jgi:hypothetical protein